ncbi:MAG: GNAT family N-acetyltransferase [Cyclobacteriaceae bacterium]|nr:GNAT family N-acetyltransferase [Cyclobacteriaceae bacterium]
MSYYKILGKENYNLGDYALVPIRMEDRYDIMRWRNEQVYHLRQEGLLTEVQQDKYFYEVVSALYQQEQPPQLLFSFLEKGLCIGYGGMVHINWKDRNAELSFLMNTRLEAGNFEKYWSTYLKLIEQVAFDKLSFHKIYTYAFDLRPHLYLVLEKSGFIREATLKQHCFFEGKFADVVIHARFAPVLRKATAEDEAITYSWASDPGIRQHSFQQKPIKPDEHSRWFREKIIDQQSLYYLMERGIEIIGSVRFDISKDGEAILSYLIDPAHQGKGEGRRILKLGRECLKMERPGVHRICAHVMNVNKASVRIFENEGYSKVKDDGYRSLYILKL